MYGGTLAITTLPGFGPGAYPLFTYTNSATNLGLAFESSFLAVHPGSTITLDTINKRVVANITAAQFLPGDYNQNGTVDAADYVLWRNGGPLQNDATPGVQPGDYDVWRANFGQTAGNGAGADVNAPVPEPTSFLLMAVAAGWWFRRGQAG
jgi:hypothetical protein